MLDKFDTERRQFSLVDYKKNKAEKIKQWSCEN